MEQEKQGLHPAFAEKNIPVVLAASNLFVPYAGVFIQSLIDHASPEKNYDIIIMERDISEANQQLLGQLAERHGNISIRFYDPSHIFEGADQAALGDGRYPAEVYYKILSPFIFREYSRLLIVDADTILKRDIAELYAADLGGCCVGAVLDITREGNYRRNYTVLNKMPLQEYYRTTLPMKEPCRYVNSGVLVIDVETFCRALDMQRVFHLGRNRELLLADQDALNLLLEGQIAFLDMAWNVQVSVNARTRGAIEAGSAKTQETYRQACAAPALLHWNGKPKPWVCPDVPLGHEWWSVALRTPFVGHIIARMIADLEERREYYLNRYGVAVKDIWAPEPKGIKRD